MCLNHLAMRIITTEKLTYTKNMECNQLNRFGLIAALLCFAGNLVFGQECAATKVDYDPVDISELISLQKEKREVEGSENYIDMFYIVLGMKPTGYRLIVNADGDYKLTKTPKDGPATELKSGVLDKHVLDKLKNIEVDQDANFLSKCKGVTSSESAEFILLKKVGSIKVYSLDGELERTLKENEMDDLAYCFQLLNSLVLKKSINLHAAMWPRLQEFCSRADRCCRSRTHALSGHKIWYPKDGY